MDDKKKVPKLRFKGFTDDWEQRKLLDMLIHPITDGPHETPKLVKKGIPFISVEAIVDGKLDFTRKRGCISSDYNDQCNKKYKPQIHDVYLVKSGSTVGKVAIVETNKVFNIWSPLAAMRVNKYHNSYFLYFLLQTDKLQDQIKKKSKGGTQPNLSMRILEKCSTNYTNFEEETKIAKLLNKIDQQLVLQKRKLEQLKLLKKAMLQKCFTKKSAPTLRFKGFSKAWTEYPLGNLGKARSGYGFPNSEQGGNKGIPFYKVSDMNLSGNEDEMIYANNYVTDAQIDRNNWKPIVDVPAIFFAKVGAAVLLNRKRLCKRPFLLYNNTMAYSLNKNILSTQFTKSLFETIKLPSSIQVGALPSYNTNDIESIKVKIPKIDEQEKNGILLKKIERLISRQQSKIKKLHSTKQFLLQNMFI